MVSMTITIEDDCKAKDLLMFLRDIDFLKISVVPPHSEDSVLDNAFGIWKDRDISLAEIRERAWR